MPADSIAIHVNREDNGDIDVTPPAIETDRSFDLEVANHGEPVHLHARASDDIADVVRIRESNPYVESDGWTVVPVVVDGHTGPRSGTIELATRFGANSATVDVTLTGGVGPEQRVDVDERLAKPPARELDDATDMTDPSAVPVETLGLIGLAGLALLVALAATVLVGGPYAFFGVAIVLAGILVAGYLLVDESA